jgi:hypothetical protein
MIVLRAKEYQEKGMAITGIDSLLRYLLLRRQPI